MKQKKNVRKTPQKFCFLTYSVYFCIRQRAVETGWWLSVKRSNTTQIEEEYGNQ